KAMYPSASPACTAARAVSTTASGDRVGLSFAQPPATTAISNHAFTHAHAVMNPPPRTLAARAPSRNAATAIAGLLQRQEVALLQIAPRREPGDDRLARPRARHRQQDQPPVRRPDPV